MTQYSLNITLMSDATFGRGDGIAGLVDEEIEHDSATGLPYIRGRVLRGLMVEECANLLFGLSKADATRESVISRLTDAARWLFGEGGSEANAAGHLHVGRATLPQTLCENIAAQVMAHDMDPGDVLESLTTIRRQSSVNDAGAPEVGSLRSMRVLLRSSTVPDEAYQLVAPLTFDAPPNEDALALLAACVSCVHRGGTGRNRGRGRMKCVLDDDNATKTRLETFETLLKGGQA